MAPERRIKAGGAVYRGSGANSTSGHLAAAKTIYFSESCDLTLILVLLRLGNFPACVHKCGLINSVQDVLCWYHDTDARINSAS